MGIDVILKEYAAYHLWANKRVVDRSAEEPAETLDSTVPSSFPSLRATLLHMRDAENTWLKRLRGEEYTWPASPETAIEDLLRRSEALHDHVMRLGEADMQVMIAYRDLRGNEHSQAVWQILMHCFNHSTYHRGQLITMMRMLSLDRIPNTDLIVFQRSVKG